MQAFNRIAFKEWAVICHALAEGQQSLILRKGGIQERRGEFQVEQSEFWLFPTYLHQESEGLVEEAGHLLNLARTERPPEEIVRISHYAVVEDVIRVSELGAALRLVGYHIWSHRTIERRFHYKQPGLYVLPVRVHRVLQAFELPNSPHFAGCRSWVELGTDLSTTGATPVLDDEEFAQRLSQIRQAVSPVGPA